MTKTATAPGTPEECTCRRQRIEASGGDEARATCLECGAVRLLPRAAARIELIGTFEIMGTAEPEAEAPELEPEAGGAPVEAGDEDQGELEPEAVEAEDADPGAAIDALRLEHGARVQAEMAAEAEEVRRLEAQDEAAEDEERADAGDDDGTE